MRKGSHMTLAQRKTLSLAHKGLVRSEESKRKLKLSLKKFWTPEEKQKQSQRMLALHITRSAKTRKKMSLAQKGKRIGPRPELRGRKRTGQAFINLRICYKSAARSAKLSAAAKRNIPKQKKRNGSKELYLLKLLNKLFPGVFVLNNKRIAPGRNSCIPDFVGPVLVEFFGSYWHGERKTGHTRAEEERLKVEYYKRVGYVVVIIWEDELNLETVNRKVTEGMSKL